MGKQQGETRPDDKFRHLQIVSKHSMSKLTSIIKAKKHVKKKQNTQQMSRRPGMISTQHNQKQTRTSKSTKLAKTIKFRHLQNCEQTKYEQIDIDN